jgi:hypothetical protein
MVVTGVLIATPDRIFSTPIDFGPNTLIFTEKSSSILTVSLSPGSQSTLAPFSVTLQAPDQWLVTGDQFILPPWGWLETQVGFADFISSDPGGGFLVQSDLPTTAFHGFADVPDSTVIPSPSSAVKDLSMGSFTYSIVFVDEADSSEKPISTPEPSALSLLFVGLAGLGYRLRRRRPCNAPQ